jgi:TP901 family phage tail tape measure protein
MAGGSSLTQLIFRLSLIDNLSGGVTNAQGNLNRLSGSTDRLRTGMMRVTTGVAGLWALGNAIKMGTDEAIKFEAAMANVAKVTEFKSPKDFKDFSNDILKMSRTIPLTAVGLAEIAAAGGQQGIKAPDLGSFVESTAKMSTAFDMLPSEAGDAIGKMVNIFSIPVQQIGHLGDAVNYLSNNVNAKARDIVDVLARVGGSSRQFGVTATQVSALSSTLLSLGQAPEVAGTTINALFLKLNTAEIQKKKFQEGLKQIGMTSDELAANIKKGAQPALMGFLEKISTLDKHQQALVLGRMFGMEYAPKLATLVQGLDVYKKHLALVGDEMNFNGSMEHEFAIKTKTTANSIQLLSNHWDELKINMGSMFLPAIVSWIGKFNERLSAASDKVSRWTRLFPNLTNLLVGVVGAIVAVIAALSVLSIIAGTGSLLAGGFGLGWTAVKFALTPLAPLLTAVRMAWVVLRMSLLAGTGVFAAIKAALFAFSAQLWINITALWAWAAALLANPITWIVIGVLALIAAIALCVIYWDEIKAAVLSFSDAVITSASTWLESIGAFGVVNAVLSGISAVISTIVFLWNNWQLVIGLVGQAIISTAGSWMQSIGLFSAVDMILAAWESLKGWWSGFKSFLAGLNPFSGIMDQVNQLKGVLSSLSGASFGLNGMTMPSTGGAVSTGVAAANGGLGAKITNNSSGGKNTNVTVHNYGQKMNGATLANEMKMAGGG